MADKSVKLSTTSFREVPLCELCLEDALKAGAAKNERLKPEEFHETSIRFCVDGLGGWLETYADAYYDGVLHRLLRDVSWQWASYCETNVSILKLRADLAELRFVISETNYTQLMDKLTSTQWRMKELGYSKKPINIHLPAAPYSVISHSATRLDISFSKFFQVGLAWSLSTNSMGLYASWVSGTVTPLLASLEDFIKGRLEDLADIQGNLFRRLSGGTSDATSLQ